MSLLFLIALVLSLGSEPARLPIPAREPLRLAATALGVAAVILVGRWQATRAIRAIDASFVGRLAAYRRYLKWRRALGLFSLVVFAIVILQVRWGTLVLDHWGLRGWPVGDVLAVLLPYLVAEIAGLWQYFDVERAMRRHFLSVTQVERAPWPRGEFINTHFRALYGVWLAGSLLLTSLRDLAHWIAPTWTDSTIFGTALVVGLGLFVLALSPWILRLVWRAVPLPPGPLRRLLEDLGKQLGFRCANILVWRTHGRVANAAITGFAPPLRYVMFSDGLIEELAPEEVAAVFGHEVGHIKLHHLSYYLIFLGASAVFIVLLVAAVQAALWNSVAPDTYRWFESIWEYAPPELVLMGIYLGIVFGHLSRRFERQADLFGSRAASRALAASPRTGLALPPIPESLPPLLPEGVFLFTQSLERVAALNGMNPNQWSWRHGSIAQRVRFLEAVGRDPTLADRFERSIRRLRWGLAMGLVMGIVALSLVTPGVIW